MDDLMQSITNGWIRQPNLLLHAVDLAFTPEHEYKFHLFESNLKIARDKIAFDIVSQVDIEIEQR
jgi:hypothetical protein